MERYRRGELSFDVIDRGPHDGIPVLLLHGFPQFNTSWTPVMDRLAREGYRCVAPNQRGYSPGARPRRRRDYRAEQLVGDVIALIDAIGAEKVHLVGHDWGGNIAWATAALAPERVGTLTTLSVPHPAAFFHALGTSRQFIASWYVYFFQLPKLPEWLLSRDHGSTAIWLVANYMGQSAATAQRDVHRIIDTGALTTALNWYRAIPFNKPGLIQARIQVPTMHVWSDGDKALLEKASRNTGDYVDAEYRYEGLHGATHWMPDQHPDAIADLLLEWLGKHPLS